MTDSGKYCHRGFTLVEILVAMVIFALIMTTLFSSFRAFISSSHAVKDHVNQNDGIRAVFQRISMDLEAIYIQQPPRYKKPELGSDPDPYRFAGREESLGGRAVSAMAFASFAHAGTHGHDRKGVARIAYYVKENDNHGFDLYRSDSLAPFPEEVTSCTDPVLGRNISGFDADFIDDDGEAHKNWDSDDGALKYQFPARIDLKIVFGSGEKTQRVESSFRLRVERKPVDDDPEK